VRDRCTGRHRPSREQRSDRSGHNHVTPQSPPQQPVRRGQRERRHLLRELVHQAARPQDKELGRERQSQEEDTDCVRQRVLEQRLYPRESGCSDQRQGEDDDKDND